MVTFDRQHRARCHHDGVAVWGWHWRPAAAARDPAAARAVLHHERLAEALLELLAQDAGEQARDPARAQTARLKLTGRFG